MVTASGGVVCERSMYGSERSWGHNAAGVTQTADTWYLAEGCTASGFETWILVSNPGDEDVAVDMTLHTGTGEVQGPSDLIPPGVRRSYNLGEYVTTYDVSTMVTASGGVVCERSMYGESTREMEPPMDGDPIYPFTREESIACGHWPPGSLDYPYFGAPRSNSRIHAGIDVYPPAGEGAAVRAIKDGTVIKVGLFYTRYTGEKTYAVLVDHGDFVANYAEVRPPALVAGSTLEMGDLVGYISGTRQLHFEMYTPGTTDWLPWYGEQPANLLDPTQMMLELY